MIINKIKTREELIHLCNQLKKENKKIGFTSGSFDLLHAGHIDYLEKAKNKVDVLIVALNSDASVKSYKGENRPIIPEKERISIISALQSVNYVFLFDEKRNNINIECLKPDYYIKAGDYNLSQLSSKEIVEKHGGEVILIPVEKDVSTSRTIEKINKLYGDNKDYIEFENSVHIPIKSTKKYRAIFLDRDGTINKDIEYLHEPEKFELLPNVIEGMLKMQNLGFKLVIITNQPGIGIGYYSKEDFYKINRTMFKFISPKGISIDKIYFCPHSKSENCECRKPGIALLKRAEKEGNIELEKSYFIGDKISDINAGKKASCKTILVTTGKEYEDPILDSSPDYIAKDLLDAYGFILSQERN